MASWKDKVRNEDVLARLGVKKELLKAAKINKLSYFGHIARHDCLPRTILTGIQEKKRMSKTDDIKDWTNIKMTECMHLAQDRVTWRYVARRLVLEDT